MRNKIDVAEIVDAKKEKIGPSAAVKLAKSVNHVWVAKGKKCIRFNMKKDAPSDAELKKVMIGPSGNLRAPTMRKGKTLYVGFHPEEFGPALT